MRAAVHLGGGCLERQDGTVKGLITHRRLLARLAEAVALMRRQEAVKVYVTP